MSVYPPPLPLNDPIAYSRRSASPELEGKVTPQWVLYLSQRDQSISASPVRVTAVSLTGQNASIGATAIPTQPLGAGLYAVEFYARIQVAAGVSSSLIVSILWTDATITCSRSGTAITGNTVATTGTGRLLIRVDNASPVSYATTYASNPAGAMQYSLDVVLTRIA